MKLSEVIKEWGLKVKSCDYGKHNPYMVENRGMDNWSVVIHNKKNNKRMTVPFSKGYGHGRKEPTIDEVMYCLMSDYTHRDLELPDFMCNFGYDDPYVADKVLRGIKFLAKKLEKFFGGREVLESIMEDIDLD